jgi:hypothetical protein
VGFDPTNRYSEPAVIGLAALEEQSQAASWRIDSIRRPSFPATPRSPMPCRKRDRVFCADAGLSGAAGGVFNAE